jgi:hypothetical protein
MLGLQEIDFSCVSEESTPDAVGFEEGKADAVMAAALALNVAVVAPAATFTDAGTVSDGLLLVRFTLPAAALKETVLLAYEPRAIFH